MKNVPPLSYEDLARIVVIGSSGVGKTTLAQQLAQALGQTHIELDALHWLPDWQERPEEEFLALLESKLAHGRWVVDGNYSKAQPVIWSQATTIIWLNYSFATAFGRVFKRTIKRAWTKELLWSTNRESWRISFFSRDSILWWVITSYHRRRRQYQALFQQTPFPYPARHIIECRHPREAAVWVARCQEMGKRHYPPG